MEWNAAVKNQIESRQKDRERMLNMTVRDDEDPRYWSETLGFRCVYPLDVIGK